MINNRIEYDKQYSTGLIKLDEVLNGGLYNSIITEISGAPGCGKTQLILNILINHLTLYSNTACIFFETQGVFPIYRLKEMIVENGNDINILKNVYIKKVYRFETIIKTLQNLMITKESKSNTTMYNYSLIIIDSIANLFKYTESEDLFKYVKRAKCLYRIDEKPALGLTWQTLVNLEIRLDNNKLYVNRCPYSMFNRYVNSNLINYCSLKYNITKLGVCFIE